MQYNSTGFPQYVSWYQSLIPQYLDSLVPYPSPVTSSAACSRRIVVAVETHRNPRCPSRHRLLLLPSLSVASQPPASLLLLLPASCPTPPATASIAAAAVSGHCAAAAAFQPRRASFFSLGLPIGEHVLVFIFLVIFISR